MSGYKYGEVLFSSTGFTPITTVIFQRFLIKIRCLTPSKQGTFARSSSIAGSLCHFGDIAIVQYYYQYAPQRKPVPNSLVSRPP